MLYFVEGSMIYLKGIFLSSCCITIMKVGSSGKVGMAIKIRYQIIMMNLMDLMV